MIKLKAFELDQPIPVSSSPLFGINVGLVELAASFNKAGAFDNAPPNVSSNIFHRSEPAIDKYIWSSAFS